MNTGTTSSDAAARPERHDLLRVASRDWPSVAATLSLSSALSSTQATLVERWGRTGWPVIARRRAPGERPGAVPVGVPLPPSLGKVRVALSIPDGVPWLSMQGVRLSDARPVAPPAWRETIDAVLHLGLGLQLAPHVFGALLWQSLTGLTYLGASSDLDLLWSLPDARAIGPLLDGLERIEANGPIRIDGEVLTASGGVNWREFARARETEDGLVMAKGIERAALVSTSSILMRESSPCC